MSYLSRKQLRIGLYPDRLILAGHRGGLRPTTAWEGTVAVEAPDEARHWQPALDALPQALERFNADRRDVTVILSNHFVRYALLPWNAVLKGADEWLALARHRLAGVHGQASADWEIQVSETAPRGPRVACAIDKSLLDCVEATVAGSGAQLASVQPLLMAAFNRMRPRPGESRWLVIAETGRLTLVLVELGVWRAIRSRQVADDWRAELPQMLERKTAILGVEQPCEEVVVCTHELFDAQPETCTTCRWLPLQAVG